MGDYSLEPPRRELFLHHTYDAIEPELDRVLDTGPQEHDGSIVGTVETRVPGIDGDAVRVEGDANSYVSINAQPGQQETITTTSWVYFEESVEPASDNVEWALTLNGGSTSLFWEFPEEFDGWHYFVGWYDGSQMRIYHGTEDEQPELVASQDESGTVDNDFLLEITMSFSARIDDTRVYKDALTREQRNNIWRMATEHVLSPAVADLWPTPGLPYEEGEGNERFAGALSEKAAWVERALDQIREARHIDDAAGTQLDNIGDLAGLRRREGELDPQYRARIKATVIAGRSGGTFRDILDAMVSILDTSYERVQLVRDDAAIAVCEITIQTTDIDNSPITQQDLTDAAQDMVLAGHDVTVVQSNQNAFTLKSDGETDDADLGLTSDGISTGGTLVEDI